MADAVADVQAHRDGVGDPEVRELATVAGASTELTSEDPASGQTIEEQSNAVYIAIEPDNTAVSTSEEAFEAASSSSGPEATVTASGSLDAEPPTSTGSSEQTYFGIQPSTLAVPSPADNETHEPATPLVTGAYPLTPLPTSTASPPAQPVPVIASDTSVDFLSTPTPTITPKLAPVPTPAQQQAQVWIATGPGLVAQMSSKEDIMAPRSGPVTSTRSHSTPGSNSRELTEQLVMAANKRSAPVYVDRTVETEVTKGDAGLHAGMKEDDFQETAALPTDPGEVEKRVQSPALAFEDSGRGNESIASVTPKPHAEPLAAVESYPQEYFGPMNKGTEQVRPASDEAVTLAAPAVQPAIKPMHSYQTIEYDFATHPPTVCEFPQSFDPSPPATPNRSRPSRPTPELAYIAPSPYVGESSTPSYTSSLKTSRTAWTYTTLRSLKTALTPSRRTYLPDLHPRHVARTHAPAPHY